MKNFLISTAAIALFSVAPASAQLLGGGLGGGAAGQLGGGLGGRVGGVGGTLGGNVNGSVEGTFARTRTVTDAASQARAQARRVERSARREDARQRKLGLAPDNLAPNAATSAAFAGNGAVDARSVSLAGNAAGNANAASTADIAGRSGFGTRGLPTRGIVAATERGMRRVAQTGRGVPVFVAATAVPVLVAGRRAMAYPVYHRGAYYGGGDTVFVSSVEVGGYVDRQYDDLRRDISGTGASLTRRGNDLVLELPADVTFAFDKADIQPRFLGTLSAVARSLGEYRATDVEIVGHTDSVGSDAYNLVLSERRGRSVADFLVDRAADPSRLVVEAMGESAPVASNATITGRAANRRVEIILHPRVD